MLLDIHQAQYYIGFGYLARNTEYTVSGYKKLKTKQDFLLQTIQKLIWLS